MPFPQLSYITVINTCFIVWTVFADVGFNLVVDVVAVVRGEVQLGVLKWLLCCQRRLVSR